MDDVFLHITEFFAQNLVDVSNAVSFVKMQAVRRCIRERYKHNRDVWMCLLLQFRTCNARLPPHLGLRRKAILAVRIAARQCSFCRSTLNCSTFYTIQTVLCRDCFFRNMVSDIELQHQHGWSVADVEHLMRRSPYVKDSSKRFFVRRHVSHQKCRQ
jgi:hypothetical protein